MLPFAEPEMLLHKKRIDPDTLDSILKNQILRVRNVLTRKSANITDATLNTAAQFIHERVGMLLTLNQMRQFSELFPELRAELSECEAYEDSTVGELLLDSLSCFLCGCEYKDDPRFHRMMRDQVEQLWPEGEENA